LSFLSCRSALSSLLPTPSAGLDCAEGAFLPSGREVVVGFLSKFGVLILGEEATDKDDDRFGTLLSTGLRVVQLELALYAKLDDLRDVRRSSDGGILSDIQILDSECF
jgi:hypothetical protein